MTQNKTKEYEADMKRWVRQVGESLIKNADDIVGTYQFGTTLEIRAEINPAQGYPEISIIRGFIPERYLEEQGVKVEV